ncbi:MAG TPA: alpha-amylase family protein [Nocardioidaceae bacterium]|nr:alpha-amylase family protein [Nocardioidaceae bacterium]
MTTDWASHAVWWHVYPLGFLGAEKSAVPATTPRLPGLEPWLDYLVGLGANGLMLGPVFASGTHGYDTHDHFAIDSRLGTEDDLVDLAEACHSRGIRLQLDGVFNHVGRGFPAFTDVVEKGAGSPYASWFHLDFDRPGPDGFGYRSFEGHEALVTLNHANPDVADHVSRVMSYWCERGVDSWRLDAAYAVPAEFWAGVLPNVRAEHPDVWVTGEMIHGDYARYVEASGIDSITQYELWKAIWSSLNDRNLFELAHTLKRHAALLPTFLPQTFVGNHDVTRIASQLDDDRHIALALAVLFALPGVPSVYYGDERGWRGVKEHRVGGDDTIRPAYPADPAGLEPSGEGLYDLHRQLIGVRRRNPWLNSASPLEPDVLSNEVLALRLTDSGHSAALVLNVGDSAAPVHLPVTGAEVVAGSGTIRRAEDGSVQLSADPHSFVLLA